MPAVSGEPIRVYLSGDRHMRPKFVLGWGLAGVVATASAATAQFASDRAASPPALPPVTANSGANNPSTPEAPPSAHPWYVKPEHGQWMICVKSYAGPQARQLAEELAKEIRQTYRVPAYLFEKGSDEKKRQEAFIAQERARQEAELEKFMEVARKQREEAALKGMEFMEPKPKLRIPKYQAIDEQWAVLIGGWKDMDTARKELDKVRAWQPPKNENLMDRGVITKPGQDGQLTGEVASINPFLYGMVVPNPVAPKSNETDRLDPVIAKLNEKEELSVLRIQKPYTIVVKSFHPFRRRVDGKDAEKSVMERLFGKDDGQEMQVMAQQAVEFAKALRAFRDEQGNPRPIESYVLHTLHGTLVCVGQFDGPDDPEMARVSRELEALRFNVRREDTFNEQTKVKLFDPLFAMQIPRAK
jgi:hypothetical protein